MSARRKCILAWTALGLLATLIGCEKHPAPPADKGQELPTDARGFRQTPSGLKFKITNQTDGKRPTPKDSIVVMHRGWLDDGTEFDNSFKEDEGKSFQLGGDNMIAGWTEGLQYLGEGGEMELEVPPTLGYGAAGHPPQIPPDATLHFTVKLMEVF